MQSSDRQPLDLEARDVWFSYDDNRDVLTGISLSVGRGEFVALIGQNGSGKTTLAKHFMGLLRPRRGTVRVEGEDICEEPVGRVARRVGYVFQNPDHQIFSSNVWDEIAFGLRNLDLEPGVVDLRTEAAIDRFGLAEYVREQPASLSWGLRRTVALASVFAMEPQVLILDEPTGGLDRRAELEIMALLGELNKRGRSIVLITHDMRLVAEHARRTILLRRGRVLADVETRALLKQNELLAAGHFSPPQVWQLARRLGFERPSLSVKEFCEEFGRRLDGVKVTNVGRT